jgi:hypothetical protein
MAEKPEDNRDVFEKALDDEAAFMNSPQQKALKKKIEEEQFDRGMRGIGGTAAGLAAYAIGRKLIRKRLPHFDDQVRILPPLVASVGGGVAGRLSGGPYPATEAKKKRRK